jgi:chromosome segregation ATPase
MDSHELKYLQTSRNQTEALHTNAKAKMVEAQHEMEAYKSKMVEAQREMERHKKNLKHIDDMISNLQKKVVVSEHAILRYFERVLGFDLDTIRKKVLDTNTEQLIKSLGDGSYPVETTHKIKVRDNTVVTIL